MRTNASARIATIVLALEALGLLIVAGWQVLELMSGDAGSAVSGIALIVLTVIGAAAVAAFAVGTARDISWGRSGGIVAQLLVLAVALGAVTGAYAHPLIGLGLAVVGVAGLVPLILEVRRAGIERKRDEDGRR